ncbi:MAG TPA: hypothetical protein VFI24_18070 [Pyrinomonadaceae bacterium]|nr:hypothetical protein [Pyrinomonadaceae bacterium]
MSPFAVASRGDESGSAQVSEVAGNLWLVRLQNLDARTDTQLVVTQQMDETQASLISERFE